MHIGRGEVDLVRYFSKQTYYKNQIKILILPRTLHLKVRLFFPVDPLTIRIILNLVQKGFSKNFSKNRIYILV